MVGAVSDSEELGGISEGLKLQGISGGVEEEHRPLLTRLALESQVGLDDEVGARDGEPLGEVVKPVDLQDQTQVGNRHIMAVNRISARNSGSVIVDLVSDYLVALDVPIGPALCRAAAVETKHVAVEPARGIYVVDRDGQVERRKAGGDRHPTSILIVRSSGCRHVHEWEWTSANAPAEPTVRFAAGWVTRVYPPPVGALVAPTAELRAFADLMTQAVCATGPLGPPSKPYRESC